MDMKEIETKVTEIVKKAQADDKLMETLKAEAVKTKLTLDQGENPFIQKLLQSFGCRSPSFVYDRPPGNSCRYAGWLSISRWSDRYTLK